MGTFRKVADAKDLPPGGALAVDVGAERIALFEVGGACYAIADTCTHRGGPLSQGRVDGTTVTCPFHGAQFDVCTGKNLTPPAPGPVTSYKVRVEGDEIQIELP